MVKFLAQAEQLAFEGVAGIIDRYVATTKAVNKAYTAKRETACKCYKSAKALADSFSAYQDAILKYENEGRILAFLEEDLKEVCSDVIEYNGFLLSALKNGKKINAPKYISGKSEYLANLSRIWIETRLSESEHQLEEQKIVYGSYSDLAEAMKKYKMANAEMKLVELSLKKMACEKRLLRGGLKIMRKVHNILDLSVQRGLLTSENFSRSQKLEKIVNKLPLLRHKGGLIT